MIARILWNTGGWIGLLLLAVPIVQAQEVAQPAIERIADRPVLGTTAELLRAPLPFDSAIIAQEAKAAEADDAETECMKADDAEADDAEADDAEADDAEADDAEADDAETECMKADDAEEEITITGTRTERSVRQSPSSITVIDAEEINRRNVERLDDLFRYEPGISTGRDPNRFGFQDFNIRGIEGNRILIQIDGIRTGDAFSFGSTNIGRDQIEVDVLKRVEVIRGSASTLYGSDAIGGVVTFLTKDPQDFLLETGDDIFFGVKAGYDSVNQGFSQTVTAAGRMEQVEALAIFTNRNGQESQINSDATPNPATTRGNNWLLKFAYRPDAFNTVNLTGEFLRRDIETDVQSSLSVIAGANRIDFQADDQVTRDRFSLAYEFRNPDSSNFFQTLRAQLYYQSVETTESSTELFVVPAVSNAPPNRLRERESLFGQYALGGDILFESNFQTGALTHRLVYGADVSSTQNVRLRDGLQRNLRTGQTTNRVGPDVFPVKDFADTENFRLGLYVQDEISVGNLTIIPGVRFDTYRLTPEGNDPFFLKGTGNTFVSSEFQDSAISPRVGIVYNLSPQTLLFAQYAKGFRAPTAVDINPAFTNPGFYRTIPNPDLEAERSDGFEVGVRGNYDRFKFGLSGFYNTYNNFIDTFGSVTPTPGLIVGTFQTVNLDRVRIWGLEGSAELQLGSGFSLLGGIAYTVGDDLSATGDARPLASIEPLKAVARLRYRATDARWGAELAATLAGKPRLPSTSDLPNPFIADPYTTIDLTGFYQLNDQASLNIGIFNLFNTSYFLRSSTRGLAADDPNIGLFAQPGITIGANFTMSF